MRFKLFSIVIALLVCASFASAGTIRVDEYGNGLPYVLGPDPTGGVEPSWPVLIYTLPFLGVAGDVQIFEAGPSGPMFDVVRFTGQGTMIFYSDNTDGIDALADTPHPPSPWPNVAFAYEIGPEGNNHALYTPLSGQPGYDASNPDYDFVSDVPEPGTLLLLGSGLIGAAGFIRRRVAG